MYFLVLAVWVWNVYLFRVAWKNWWAPPLAIEDLDEPEEPDSHHLD
jgi:hypothetical protein